VRTWRGVCLEDRTLVDDREDPPVTFTLKRGKDYCLGFEKDGKRCVISQYWVWVPSEWFGGIKPEFGHAQPDSGRGDE
jgi:hypothetical protein